jgi:hypothetical protein
MLCPVPVFLQQKIGWNGHFVPNAIKHRQEPCWGHLNGSWAMALYDLMRVFTKLPGAGVADIVADCSFKNYKIQFELATLLL